MQNRVSGFSARRALAARVSVGVTALGAVKTVAHHADPFASAWCRTRTGGEVDIPMLAKVGGEWLFMGHCWGCYATLLGALALLAALHSSAGVQAHGAIPV